MTSNNLNSGDQDQKKSTNHEGDTNSFLSEENFKLNYSDYIEKERKLKESEEKFRSLVQYSMEPILIVDLQGSILFVNNATARTLESDDLNYLIGRNVMELIAPESREDVIKDFYQVSLGIDAYVAEYQVITLKGNRIVIESIGKIINYEGNKADLLSLKDITQRKKIETELIEKNKIITQALNEISSIEDELRSKYDELLEKEHNLKDNEERFEAVFSMVPDPIIITRASNGEIILLNDSAAEIMGISKDNIIGRKTLDFRAWIKDEDREIFLSDIKKFGQVDKKDLLWRKSDGEYRNILFSSRSMKFRNEIILINVGWDITELKRIEKALKDSEEMFRNPVENSPVGVYLYQDSCFRYINPRLASMFGYHQEELIGKTLETLISCDDRKRVAGIFINLHEKHFSGRFMECKGIKKDGTVIHLEAYASLMQYQDKAAIYGTIIDITWKKVTEQKLNTSEEQYRLITENMKDVVWILDIDSDKFRYISPSVKSLIGYSVKDITSRPFDEFVSPYNVKPLKDLFQREKEEFLKNILIKRYFSYETELLCFDGSSVITETIANFFINQDTGKVELLGVTRDITVRKRIERENESQNFKLGAAYEEIQSSYEELRAAEEERQCAFEKLEENQEALKESEQSLKKAQAIAHLGIYEWDITNDLVYASDEFKKIFGIESSNNPSIQYIVNQRIVPADRDLFNTSLEILLKSGLPFSIDFWIILDTHKNRAIRCLGEIEFTNDGKSRYLILIVQDITRQKLMEEEIKETYLEKETLLREIHHRVKNNMQIISSLLSLQSRAIIDPNVKSLFIETQNRVRSLAFVHEFLYQSDSLNKINYKAYLHKITTYLLQSYNLTRGAVICNIDIEDLELTIEQAVPCSLIITELLTNSFKYAFNQDQKGEIRIKFTYDLEKKYYHLDYRDNGPGFPAGYDPKKNAGFGSTLINGLIQQLSGKLWVKNGNPGVHYTFYFPSG